MHSTRLLGAILTTCVAIISVSAHAQEWPVKPVRIINPFSAGGGTDTFARPLAAKLTQHSDSSSSSRTKGAPAEHWARPTRQRRRPMAIRFS